MNTNLPRRVVLAAVGSRGDVQPMFALALALAARGHAPLVAAPPDFASAAAGLGLEFAPLGRDMQQFLSSHPDLLTGKPSQGLPGMKSYFADQLPVQVRQLLSICAGADAVLWCGLGFAAASVAERLQLPWLGILYTTCMLPSSRHAPPALPWQGLPRWANRVLWRLHRMVATHVFGRALNVERVAMGLPASGLHELFFKRGNYVFATDSQLFPPDPEWAGRFPHAGFIFFDDPATLDPELAAWLDEGEPPVFVGFGSMTGHGTERVGRLIVDALSASGRRCLIGSGWARLGEGRLPPGWRMVREAPHPLLFPRVCVVVHHGGSGTTANALRAGVPQVLVPLILDQYHHAHLLFRAGLAPRPVSMERITAAQLAQSVREALELPAAPRMAAARRLREADACAAIVQRVESLPMPQRS